MTTVEELTAKAKGFRRCVACAVSWYGTEPCWCCGELGHLGSTPPPGWPQMAPEPEAIELRHL